MGVLFLLADYDIFTRVFELAVISSVTGCNDLWRKTLRNTITVIFTVMAPLKRYVTCRHSAAMNTK